MHEESSSVDYAWQKEEPKRLDLVNCSCHLTKVVEKTISYSVTPFDFDHGLNGRDLGKLTRLTALTHVSGISTKLI